MIDIELMAPKVPRLISDHISEFFSMEYSVK